MPLNFDGYLAATAVLANTGPFVATFGVLDAGGRAQAQLVFPPLPALVGLRLDHAWVAAETSGVAVLASNAVPLVWQ